MFILGGAMGAFMTGLFCQLSFNSGGADGAFYGHPVQMWYQIAGILTAIGIILLSIKLICFFVFIQII